MGRVGKMWSRIDKQLIVAQVAGLACVLALPGHLYAQDVVDGGADAATEAVAPAAPPPAVDANAPAVDANAPAAEPPAQSAAAAAKPKAVKDGTSYNIKLRQIEENVNTLKDKIFRSKARLSQLEEMVLHGTISGAKAVLIHRNEMGSSFRLLRVQYALDGTPILTRADSGAGELDEVEEIEIFNGSIAPGNHNLSVFLQYKGNGYGVFKYLEKYDFKLKSSHAFTVEEGKQTTIKVIAFEKGGITTPMNERPAIKYDVSVASDLRATINNEKEDAAETAAPEE